MSNPKTVEDLKSQLSTTQQQYKKLLQKNQNDLIWIKQRESQVKKSLDEIETERSNWKEIQNRLTFDNQFLKNELTKVKESNGQGDDMVKSLEARVEHLEVGIGKLEKSKGEVEKELVGTKSRVTKLQEENKEKCIQIEQLKAQVLELNKNVSILSEKNSKLKQELDHFYRIQQSMTDFECQTENIQQNKCQNQQLTELQQIKFKYKQIQSQLRNKTQQFSLLQNKLSESIEQLKAMKQKNKSILIQNQSLRKHCLQADESLQKTKSKLQQQKRKNKEILNRSIYSSELSIRSSELQQQNKILKQMIKSVKTMVRVREVQIEKYKSKLNHEEKQKQKNQVHEKFKPRGNTEQYTERFHRSSQRKTEADSISTPSQKRYEKKLPKLK